MGYGAVFALLPFFVAGVLCDEKLLMSIRNGNKIISILILALGIIPAVKLPYSIHSVRSSYRTAGFNNIWGICYRLVFYVIAILIGYAVIGVMSKKRNVFTHIGEASILVYAGSTFLAPHGYLILNKIFGFSKNNWINLIAMTIYCIILIWMCAIPSFLRLYNWVLSKINDLLFKKENS